MEQDKRKMKDNCVTQPPDLATPRIHLTIELTRDSQLSKEHGASEIYISDINIFAVRGAYKREHFKAKQSERRPMQRKLQIGKTQRGC